MKAADARMIKRKLSYEFDDSLTDIIHEHKIPKIVEDAINLPVKEPTSSKKKEEYSYWTERLSGFFDELKTWIRHKKKNRRDLYI